MKSYNDVWQYRIDNAFQKQLKTTDEDIIWEIVSLILYQNDKDGLLIKLYKLFKNKEDFVKLISLLDGRKFHAPTKTEMEEALLTAILFFEKELQGKNWEEIKKNFDFKISTIKYGIKIKNMSAWLRQKIYELFKDMRSKDG